MSKVIVLISAILIIACQNKSTTPESVKSELLNTTEFVAQLEYFDNEQLVDLRTPAEVQEGFIPNALFIDFNDTPTFEAKIQNLDKNKPVMIYCRSGGRSGKTAKILIDQGFNHVIDLDGGFTAWEKANLPVDTP